VVALREAITGAEFIELASTGHFPYLTHRDMFNCALISFLTHAGKNTPLSN
jgi:pimeloyl-ACP methyl ester carboxylesterase